jgi:hypothetical protein
LDYFVQSDREGDALKLVMKIKIGGDGDRERGRRR